MDEDRIRRTHLWLPAWASGPNGKPDRRWRHPADIEAIVWAQSQTYTGAGRFKYDNKPFAVLDQPVSENRVALLTTTDRFAEGYDPKPFGLGET